MGAEAPEIYDGIGWESSVAMITAWRADADAETNRRSMESLKEDLAANGYHAVIEAEGQFLETQQDGTLKHVTEPSLLIYKSAHEKFDSFVGQMENLRARYDQDSFIVKDHQTLRYTEIRREGTRVDIGRMYRSTAQTLYSSRLGHGIPAFTIQDSERPEAQKPAKPSPILQA